MRASKHSIHDQIQKNFKKLLKTKATKITSSLYQKVLSLHVIYYLNE